MNVIHKYEIPISSSFNIKLPEKFNILKIDVQNNIPYLWIIYDTSKAPKWSVTFYNIVTGQQTELDYTRYIGSYMLHEGSFVSHVFKA